MNLICCILKALNRHNNHLKQENLRTGNQTEITKLCVCVVVFREWGIDVDPNEGGKWTFVRGCSIRILFA